MRWSLALTVVVAAAPARAELDLFKVGDGHRGALVVPTGATVVVNPVALLSTSAPAGATQLTFSAPFAAGDLLLLLHSRGLYAPPDAGVAAPMPLDGEDLGAHELVRVATVAGNTVTLTQPLVRSFRAGFTQAVLMPEYTSVTIAGTLAAAQWDGGTGGVVGFFAQDVVTLSGTVTAAARGYRGGPAYLTNGGFAAVCRPVTEDRPTDGGLAGTGPKAEGAAVTNFPFVHGGGNLANAGGGGMCHESGGGGGAHLSPGGRGGLDQQDTPGGGSGGAPFVYVPGTRLLFGGGGGCGEYHHPTDTPGGGAGGGIVFVRARAVVGAGTIVADGAGVPGTFVDNGAGGGGAAGTIVFRVFGDGGTDQVAFYARGGMGGSVATINGPGGGGSGGAIFVQGGAPPMAVNGGLGGGLRLPDGGLGDRAATPTALTVGNFAGKGLSSPEPAGHPPAPVLLGPAAMAITVARPTFSGTAVPDAGVYVFVDGLVVGQTFAPNGQFALTASVDLPRGAHRARAQAVVEGLASDRSNEVLFAVDAFDSPGAPKLTFPADGMAVSDPWVTYLGEATPLAKVTVDVDGTIVGSALATGGLFSIPSTAPLPLGKHVAYAFSDDGGIGPSIVFTVVADAGSEDAGQAGPDAGTVSPDGGSSGPRTLGVGCGCQSNGALGFGALLLLSGALRARGGRPTRPR